jgi:hypothetical protein
MLISDLLLNLNLTREYEIEIEYCPICDEHQQFNNLESVLTHLNDDDNKKETHKENARLIIEFSKHYDMITGKPLQGKLI